MSDQTSTTEPAISQRAARRTRRQLLAKGTGALTAVLAAEAISRPSRAEAANGDPIVLGQINHSTDITVISNGNSGGSTALAADALGQGVGLSGSTESGLGVTGTSNSGIGVNGFSSEGKAVMGQSQFGEGVRGMSLGGGQGSSVTNSRTGVHGVSDSGSDSAVWGEAIGGGPGVKGTAGPGTGVTGSSTGGVGVLASGKTALKVQGPAVFSRSGRLTIKAGQSTAKKSGISLSAATLVLATIQGNVAGVFVQGVTIVTGASGSFTIHLNKAAPASTKVAWFAVN
jgi:hypothetical protein